MRKPFLRILSFIMVLGLCMLFSAPALALDVEEMEYVDEVQKQTDEISELVRLIRHAKKNNDQDAVQLYKDILQRFGTQHVEGDEIVHHLEMEGIALLEEENSINAALPSVSDTANVDWYVTNYSGYYYPKDGRYYDVYMIIASPKNDQSRLHMETRTISNDAFEATWENVGAIAWDAVLSFVADKLEIDTILTVADAIYQVTSGITPQMVEEISAGEWTVHSSSDSSFAYIYIRKADTNQDYQLVMYGCEVELSYGYLQNIRIDLGNGESKTKVVSSSSDGLVFADSTYADIWYAIDMFKAGAVKNNVISFIDVKLFSINGTPSDTARIITATWVQNPNHIYGDISPEEERQ